MVLKSSIVACLFAGVAITQALPSGFRPGPFVKRQVAPPESPVSPEALIYRCVVEQTTTLQELTDQYQKLADKCEEQLKKSGIIRAYPAPTSQQGAAASIQDVPVVGSIQHLPVGNLPGDSDPNRGAPAPGAGQSGNGSGD